MNYTDHLGEVAYEESRKFSCYNFEEKDEIDDLKMAMQLMLKRAVHSALERARCEMLTVKRQEHIPISDVTDEFFEAVEICDVNGIINKLQDEYENGVTK